MNQHSDEKLFFGALIGMLGLAGIAFTIFYFVTREDPSLTQERFSPLGIRLKDFALTERDGSTVRRSDLLGKPVVVNFVFGSCSYSCLKVSEWMKKIERATQEPVQLVSFTIDPASDTPKVLAEYADRFNADPNRWWFLTGDTDAVTDLLSECFLGAPDPDQIGVIPGGWLHSDRILVLDSQGYVVGDFNGLSGDVLDQSLELLRSLGAKIK